MRDTLDGYAFEVNASAREPALPAALVRDLTSASYGERLYGEPGVVVPFDSMRIFWPYLLSAEANRSLLGSIYHLCLTHGELKWIHLSARFRFRHVFMDKTFLTQSALFLHQPTAPPPPRSHEDIEVSHCYYRNRLEHIDRYSPMWFFHAPGSGVWLNTGRIFVADEMSVGAQRLSLLHRALVKGFGAGSAPGSDTFRLRFALFMQNHSLMNVSAASSIDTVVFPLRSPPAWGGERFTELVSLHLQGREVQHIAGNSTVAGNHTTWAAGTHYVSCGRPPRLRMCSPDEPAMVVHGAMCAQQYQHPMFDLLRAAKNCSTAGKEEPVLRLALKDRRREEGEASPGWSASSKDGAELRWTSRLAEPDAEPLALQRVALPHSRTARGFAARPSPNRSIHRPIEADAALNRSSE